MLTPQQLSQLKTTVSSGGVQPGGAMTPEQAKSWVSAPAPTAHPAPFTDPGIGKSIEDTFKGGFENIKSGFSDVFSKPQMDPQAVSEAARGGGFGAGVAEAGAQALKAGEHAVAGVGKIVGGVVQAGASPVLGPSTLLGGAIGQKLADQIPPEAARKFEMFLEGHPEIGQNSTEIMNLANLAFPDVMKKASPVVDAGLTKVKEGTSVVADKASALKESVTPKPPTPEEIVAQNKAAIDTQITKAAEQWKAPTVPGKAKNPASFNKATQILKQNPGLDKFIAGQKLNVANHIENGKFATADTAEMLRETPAQLSGDFLRPSLRAADVYTPKTPVADVVKEAIASASKDKELTPGAMEDITNNMKKEMGALERKYPNGMSLEDMQDNKITYSKNGGYRSTSLLDNNTATMNRNFGAAFQKVVETKAPADVPVKPFNKYLSQFYKAADYMEALNNKNAPRSPWLDVAKRGAQVAGAVVGHALPGGSLLTGVGGYLIGGTLEHMLENMTPQMRASLLKNFEVQHPEAVGQVQQFLQSHVGGKPDTPRLMPAGENPIPAQGEVAPPQNLLEAPKGEPSANPSTLEKAKGVFNDIKTQGKRGFVKLPGGKSIPEPETLAKKLEPVDAHKIQNYLNAKSEGSHAYVPPNVWIAAEEALTKLGLVNKKGVSVFEGEKGKMDYLQAMLDHFKTKD